MEKLIPRVESAEDRHLDRSVAPTTARWSRARRSRTRQDYVDIGVKEGATLVVDGRGFKMQGYENGFFSAAGCSTTSPRTCGSTRKRSSARCSRWCAPTTTSEALALPSRPRIRQRRRDLHPRRRRRARLRRRVNVGMVGINVPIPVPLAYYTFGGWKKSGFGDLNQHGPDSIRFYTKTKTVTSRWPVRRQGRRGVPSSSRRWTDGRITAMSDGGDGFRSHRGPDGDPRRWRATSPPRSSRRTRSAGTRRSISRSTCCARRRRSASAAIYIQRGRRRLRPDPARRRADLRGAGDGLPDGRRPSSRSTTWRRG